MSKYEEVILKLQKGDIISSKKGMLFISALGETPYNEKKMEYLGEGQFRSIGDREKLENVKEY